MDFLPGALGLEVPAGDVTPELAARVVWFDALTLNVDRSWHNPNMLLWHGDPWLIDHGASLYFHHSWAGRDSAADQPYPKPADHVLLPVAGPLTQAHDLLSPLVTAELLAEVVGLGARGLARRRRRARSTPTATRQAYVDFLLARVGGRAAWLDAVEVARAAAV